MGEENVLMNRHLHIKAKELLDGTTPASTPTSTPRSVFPENENVKRLISAIAEIQLSVKESMFSAASNLMFAGTYLAAFRELLPPKSGEFRANEIFFGKYSFVLTKINTFALNSID